MKAKELAKKLGVSPATISLVLNNKPGISDSLRHSLIEKIRELGCESMLSESNRPQAEPDTAVSGLRPVIVYLIYTSCDEMDANFAFYPAVLEGAEMEARDNNYNLMVLHMSCDGNSNLPRMMECYREAIGAIIQAPYLHDNILEDVSSLDIPCVFVDAYRPEQKVSSVCINNEQGIYAAVRHLKEKGHTNIGYVYNSNSSDSRLERRRCFHQALREYGLPDLRENYFVIPGYEDGTEVRSLLYQKFQEARQLPTALIAENDRFAWQSMKALERLGLKVPDDVSLIGFDDRSVCTMVEPHLTSIRNYRHLMGRECVTMLRNIRRLQQQGFHHLSMKYEMPAELIERDSVRDLTKG